MSEPILSWIKKELAEADRMEEGGSYDGEDYWRGVSDTLTLLKIKITSGAVRAF